MIKKIILMTDDDQDLLGQMEHSLARHGYSLTRVASGQQLLAQARLLQPQAILLSLMLSDMDGMTVCEKLRKDSATAGIPILLLGLSHQESDVVSGFDSGADDYLPKPVSPRVVVARIKAVIRRYARAENETASIDFGKMNIDPKRHVVLIDGQPVDLTLTQLRILHALARQPGIVLNRDQIIRAALGPNAPVTDRVIDAHMANLRQKLGPAAKCIQTIRGVGYVMRSAQ